MLSDYRDDQWYPVFTEVLLKTLQSAFLASSVADFIACSVEALSPKINLTKSDRIIVLENLWKVFQVFTYHTRIYRQHFNKYFTIERSADIIKSNRTATEISMGNGFFQF